MTDTPTQPTPEETAAAEAAAAAAASAPAQPAKAKKLKPETLVTILTAATREELTGVITMPVLQTLRVADVPEGATVLGEPGSPREEDGFVPVISPTTRSLIWVDPGDVSPGAIHAVEGVHY